VASRSSRTVSNMALRLAVDTIVMKDRATVLLGRSDRGTTAGKWVIPGGGIGDYQTIKDASASTILAKTGVVIEEQRLLFVSELVRKEEQEHYLVLYCLGTYAGGMLVPGEGLSEVKWVDVRELGKYQDEGMGELSINAFVKFGEWVRAMAPAAASSGTVH
jgi:ADP-ribose pyrophosphatase YjhB (NUDIX family)